MSHHDSSNVAEYEAHGLYDSRRPDPARLELLDFLMSEGVGIDEIAAADRDGWLSSVLTDDRLIGKPNLTLGDVAARVGQDKDLVARVWRAAGLADPDPHAVIFTEDDVETLAIFGSAVEAFGEAPALQLARVVGSSTARIAEAEISTAVSTVDGTYSPASQLDEARTSARLLSLVPAGEKAIMHLLRRHIAAANRRLRQARAPDSNAEVVNVTIGFADLVDSTALSLQLGSSEFGQAMALFDALTSEVVATGGGRAVKLLGDESMFTAANATDACLIGLALISEFAEHDLFQGVRVGLASGPVVARDGDYFGTIVHLAARLVGFAPPDSIAMPPDLADIAVHHAAVVSHGPHRLQGFPEPVEIWTTRGHKRR